MRIETALAKGSMTRVERRDPKNLDHKMTTGELEKISPDFQWQVYFTKVGLPSLASLNVASPGFFKAMNEELDKESLADWKTYLRWHLVHADAPFLSAALLNENFAFYGKTLRGQQELQPRWKRCTENVDDDLGEALGQVYVEKYFSPEAKQQALKMVKEIEAAMAAGHRLAALDVRRHQAAGARKAARHGQQDRLSRQVARLQQAGNRSRR